MLGRGPVLAELRSFDGTHKIMQDMRVCYRIPLGWNATFARNQFIHCYMPVAPEEKINLR